MFGSLTYLLFSQLAVGGMLSIIPVPPEAGKSFFRFCALVCFALICLAIVSRLETLAGLAGRLLVLFGALTLAYAVTVIKDRPSRGLLLMAAAVGATSVLLDGIIRTESSMPWWAHGLGAAYTLSSALFLGSTIFAMILGHWYLVVPTLPIQPLRDLTLLMVGSTLAKAALVAVTLYAYYHYGTASHRETIDAFGNLQGLFFWARVLFGLVGPLVLCYMTWATVKINSTQSATGLLYVATILVLLGEPISRFLYLTTRLPV